MGTPLQVRARDGFRHAVVIGAGIAGLLAARACSSRFATVTILERDALASSAEARPGVPQERHAHFLLVRGLSVIEDMFPGLSATLAADGAVSGDASADSLLHVRGVTLPRFNSGLRVMVMSRRLLEWRLRERVMAIGNVAICDRTRVDGLRFDGGPCVLAVSGDGRERKQFPCDLVIDASGAGSAAPQWFKALGLPPPKETRVDAHVGYATRRFRRPEPWPHDWKLAAVNWWPPRNRRGGVALPEENGLLVVSLVGAGPDLPPTDEAGFADFAARLASPVIADCIALCEPVGGIGGYRPAGNRRRDFSPAQRQVNGFLAMGDALCAFNPVYGQGMTAAALQAEALMAELGARPERIVETPTDWASVQRRLAAAVTVPWLLATSEDFRHAPDVDGQMTLLNRLARGYTERALQNGGAAVTLAFHRTMQLVEPHALLRPTIAMRVLATRVRR
jgi:2-polyprenyl-6-methoxyphenol hydroxylase-like FAD-dependent oxidoreductase